MNKLVTEFLGTFFLVLTIGLVIFSNTPLGAFAIGTVLMAMVYMGAHVSGAHFNPAVSTALLVAKKMSAKEYPGYVIAQLLGATAAAFLCHFLVGQTFAPAPGPGIGMVQALIVEALFTFALCLVVFNVACSKKTEGRGFYGLAIGSTIIGAAYAGGPLSGGAFNPAVGIGPTLVNGLVGGGSWSNLWLYIVGPLIGAVIAALVFSVQEAEPGVG